MILFRHNETIRVRRLLLPSPNVGEGLGVRAIELRFKQLRLLQPLILLAGANR